MEAALEGQFFLREAAHVPQLPHIPSQLAADLHAAKGTFLSLIGLQTMSLILATN